MRYETPVQQGDEQVLGAGRSVADAARPAPAPALRSWSGLVGTLLVAVLASICVGFLSLPLVALLLRVPVGSLPAYLQEPIVHDALRLTAISSLCSLGLMLVFGTPLAYVLGRKEFHGKRLIETLVELPLVLPPAVAGVALLFAFGRRTFVGEVLHDLHLDVAFTLAAVVLAQSFVAAPFYIRSARTGFQGVSRDVIDSAATQGASGWQAFRFVMLPLALPSIAGGAVMGWARSVGEFGATILFAGNFQGTTQTMPLAIYTALESDINAAIVLAAILVLSSFTVLLVFKFLSSRSLDVTPE